MLFLFYTETCVRMELVEQISHAISACREQNGLLASLANGTLLNVIIAHLKDTEDVVSIFCLIKVNNNCFNLW